MTPTPRHTDAELRTAGTQGLEQVPGIDAGRSRWTQLPRPR